MQNLLQKLEYVPACEGWFVAHTGAYERQKSKTNIFMNIRTAELFKVIIQIRIKSFFANTKRTRYGGLRCLKETWKKKEDKKRTNVLYLEL